jgi:O-antigen/teichoic acid export membrane protein
LLSSPALRSIGGLWIAQVIKMGVSIAVSIVTIRYLGPEQYGILGVAGASVVLFSALAGLPQGGILVRELASQGEAAARSCLRHLGCVWLERCCSWHSRPLRSL